MVTKSKSANNLSGRINFERTNYFQRSKRPRQELETPTIEITGPSQSNESTRTLLPESSPSNYSTDEPQVVYLDRLHDKKARYDAHIAFLTRCIDEKVIPKGLCIQLEPTIGNFDQEFVKNWYEKLNKFSIELMKDIVGFCKTTKTEVTEQIKTKEALIQNKSSQEKYNNISNAIKENQELRVRRLTYQKNKKFNRLKYPDNQRQNFERQGRAPASNTTRDNRSRSRSKSQNRKNHFNNNQQHSPTNQQMSYALAVQGTNNNQDKNPLTNERSVERSADNRDRQIEKLQQQINFLREERKGYQGEPPKNEFGAPRVGAFRQSQTGTKENQDMTTKDVINLINNTMTTLTAFASRLEQQKESSPQTLRGM